jgi:hypothetical protein
VVGLPVEGQDAEPPAAALPVAEQVFAALQDEAEEQDAGPLEDARLAEELGVAAALQAEAEEQVAELPAAALPVAERAFAALQDEAEEQDAELPAAGLPVAGRAFAAVQDEPEEQVAGPPAAGLPVVDQVSAALPDGLLAAESDEPPVPGEPVGVRVYSDAQPEARGDFRVQADGPVAHLAARSAAIAHALPARVEPLLLVRRQAAGRRELCIE